MMNDLPPELTKEELERNAYNAAFYELGLRWHWDSETYVELQRHSPMPEARIRRYVETRHPHLLRAYDADFLAAAVQACKSRQKPCAHRSFDWAQAAVLTTDEAHGTRETHNGAMPARLLASTAEPEWLPFD